MFSPAPILGFTTATSAPKSEEAKFPATAKLKTFHVTINHSTTYADQKVDIAEMLRSPYTQKPGFSLRGDETGKFLLVTLTPSALVNTDTFTFANEAFHDLLNLLDKCRRLESKNLQGILDRYEDYLATNSLEKFSTKPTKNAFSVPLRQRT